jgi:hypothetical protein
LCHLLKARVFMSGAHPRRGGSPVSAAKAKAARSKAESLTGEVSLQYLRHHDVPSVVNEILAAILVSQPADPLAAIERHLRDVALRRGAARASAAKPQPAAAQPKVVQSQPRENAVTKPHKTTPPAAVPSNKAPSQQQDAQVDVVEAPQEPQAETDTLHVVFVEPHDAAGAPPVPASAETRASPAEPLVESGAADIPQVTESDDAAPAAGALHGEVEDATVAAANSEPAATTEHVAATEPVTALEHVAATEPVTALEHVAATEPVTALEHVAATEAIATSEPFEELAVPPVEGGKLQPPPSEHPDQEPTEGEPLPREPRDLNVETLEESRIVESVQDAAPEVAEAVTTE